MKNEVFVKDWLKRARSNLAVAAAGKTSEEVLYEDLCFHCQQSVEKSIKALLIGERNEENSEGFEDLVKYPNLISCSRLW